MVKRVFQLNVFRYGQIAMSLIAILWFTASPVFSAVTQTAVVATAEAGYQGAGAHSIVSVDPKDGPREAQNNLLPTSTTDITVGTYGRYFYRIERYERDNISKFDIAAPTTVIWNYSTMDPDDEGASSNPHSIIFVNPTKAYLLRYGKNKAWIVNPTATTQEEFKTGELDLSSYGGDDFLPRMTGGVIVGNRLFVVMQRLDQYWGTQTAYVAVFDTTTDMEIDTGKGSDGMKGIPLNFKNPMAIKYLADNNTLYVQCAGKFPYPSYGVAGEYTGGIDSINPDTYETDVVLDDGDVDEHLYGNIAGLLLVSSEKGYFVGYEDQDDNTLYSFNPTTKTVGGIVSGFESTNIGGMETGAYLDKNKLLWICNKEQTRIDILDPLTDTINESVSTNLMPLKVAFVTVGTIDDDDDNDGVPDAQAITASVDLDGDGEDDVFSEQYKGVNTVTEKMLAIKGGANVGSVLTISSVDLTIISESENRPTTMPFGLIDFNLEVTPGAEAQVVVYFSEALESGSKWYKFMNNTWEDYSAHAVISDDRKSVTLSLKDGGYGDADGEVNGIIVDPSGPGKIRSNSDDDDSCFITSSDVNQTPVFYLLIAGLILFVTTIAVDRRSRNNRSQR